ARRDPVRTTDEERRRALRNRDALADDAPVARGLREAGGDLPVDGERVAACLASVKALEEDGARGDALAWWALKSPDLSEHPGRGAALGEGVEAGGEIPRCRLRADALRASTEYPLESFQRLGPAPLDSSRRGHLERL